MREPKTTGRESLGMRLIATVFNSGARLALQCCVIKVFDVYSILLPRQHFVCFSHVAVGARLIACFVHCPVFEIHRNESNTSGEGL